MFFEHASRPLLYLFFLIAAFLENIIPPIPGDTVMLFGAFLASQGTVTYAEVLAVSSVGSVIGFMTLFFLAKRYGKGMLNRFSWVNEKQLLRGTALVNRYGYLVVFINRFLPGFRSVISLVSGFGALSTILVLLCATTSALLWNSLWIYFAYTVGGKWDYLKRTVLKLITQYNWWALLVLSVCLISYAFLWFMKRRHKEKNK